MSDNFVNLHVHTAHGSLLDSILTVKELVNFAKDLLIKVKSQNKKIR